MTGVLKAEKYFELPEDDESKPSKEELERQMSVLLPTKSPDKEDS